jgi:hypothetical protein
VTIVIIAGNSPFHISSILNLTFTSPDACLPTEIAGTCPENIASVRFQAVFTLFTPKIIKDAKPIRYFFPSAFITLMLPAGLTQLQRYFCAADNFLDRTYSRSMMQI